jgi:hypothetical protein
MHPIRTLTWTVSTSWADAANGPLARVNICSIVIIVFFSRFVFDEFNAKGGEIVHKASRTLPNRVVERRNMIMSNEGGEPALRVLGRV